MTSLIVLLFFFPSFLPYLPSIFLSIFGHREQATRTSSTPCSLGSGSTACSGFDHTALDLVLGAFFKLAESDPSNISGWNLGFPQCLFLCLLDQEHLQMACYLQVMAFLPTSFTNIPCLAPEGIWLDDTSDSDLSTVEEMSFLLLDHHLPRSRGYSQLSTELKWKVPKCPNLLTFNSHSWAAWGQILVLPLTVWVSVS